MTCRRARDTVRRGETLAHIVHATHAGGPLPVVPRVLEREWRLVQEAVVLVLVLVLGLGLSRSPSLSLSQPVSVAAPAAAPTQGLRHTCTMPTNRSAARKYAAKASRDMGPSWGYVLPRASSSWNCVWR